MDSQPTEVADLSQTAGDLGQLIVAQHEGVAAAEDYLADRTVGRKVAEQRLPALRGYLFAPKMAAKTESAMDAASTSC
jgi:hypothetical protein